jgi:membrane fusion protein (multidrug efflux system)
MVACRREEPPAAEKLPVVRVQVARVSRLQPRIAIAGVVLPLPGKDVKVGALVAGRVDQVFVSEGDAVKNGQPLAHIEAQPLKDRLTETDAQRAQTVAAAENARTRLERTRKLFQDGIASRQEVDDARAQLVAAESAVKQAQAAGGTATVQLGRATLRAPIDGVVAAILVPAGQPVDGNATPVIEIADTRELDLRAPIAASVAGQLRIGQAAELQVEGVGRVVGAVVALAPLVDVATNTVMVRVRVHNQDGRLRGGMFARGAVLLPPRDGVAVPPGALVPGDGGEASQVALVDHDGKVEHRGVRAGAETGDALEVEGVSAGDRVIVAGGYSLPDGTRVEIQP